jgi:ABC-type Fe3+ transport system permease subunit
MSYQPPPPGYGQPYGGGQPPQDHPRATTALVLGIVSLVCCNVLGIVAYIVGRNAEREIAASGGRLGGEGKAKAGKILGIVATVLLVLGLIVWVLLIATGAMTTSFEFDSGTSGDY